MKRLEKFKKQSQQSQPNNLKEKTILDLSNLNNFKVIQAISSNISNQDITSIVLDNSQNNNIQNANAGIGIGIGIDINYTDILGTISKFLSGNKNIKSVTIKVPYSMPLINSLIEGFNKCENLESLTLSNILCMDLLDEIQIPNLKTLEILDSQLNSYSPIQLLCFNNKNLKSLTLVGGQISEQQIKLMNNLFPEVTFTCAGQNNLIIQDKTELNISELFNQHFNMNFIKANEDNSQISCISMTNTHSPQSETAINSLKLSMSKGGYKKTQSIKFNDIQCNNPTTILEFIGEVNDVPVKELTLSKCNIQQDTIQILNFKDLVKFDCSNNYTLANYSTFKLISLQNPNLKFLNWSGNNVNNIESVIKFMCENPICITLTPQQFNTPTKIAGAELPSHPYNDVYVPLYLKKVEECAKSMIIQQNNKAIETFLLCVKKIDKEWKFKTPKVIYKNMIIEGFYLHDQIEDLIEEFLTNDPVYLYWEQNLAGEECSTGDTI